LLEYNADTPTALLGAAILRWHWLQDTFPGADQTAAQAWFETAALTIEDVDSRRVGRVRDRKPAADVERREVVHRLEESCGTTYPEFPRARVDLLRADMEGESLRAQAELSGSVQQRGGIADTATELVAKRRYGDNGNASATRHSTLAPGACSAIRRVLSRDPLHA
jgi:Glutathionylspermidine synthase preATP-grasp